MVGELELDCRGSWGCVINVLGKFAWLGISGILGGWGSLGWVVGGWGSCSWVIGEAGVDIVGWLPD